MRPWPIRRLVVSVAAALTAAVATGVPADLLDTPLFGRPIPVSDWAYPAWIAASVLTGVLVATARRAGLSAIGGSLLMLVAIGCPVCNKPVLLLLGETGATRWFAPIQPLIAGLAIALLAAALIRLRSRRVPGGRIVRARHERRAPWSHYSRASTPGRPPPKG